MHFSDIIASFNAFVKCTKIEEWWGVVDDFRTQTEVRNVINQHPYRTFV
ncbi:MULTISPECIES: hypothetical protein [unclassified Candidatus Tisiphia]|jgi:hypothetical protein|nr:MAG: hypothetical protein LF884_03760 [Rickettsia endosymbiont of Cimex lectularius]